MCVSEKTAKFEMKDESFLKHLRRKNYRYLYENSSNEKKTSFYRRQKIASAWDIRQTFSSVFVNQRQVVHDLEMFVAIFGHIEWSKSVFEVLFLGNKFKLR